MTCRKIVILISICVLIVVFLFAISYDYSSSCKLKGTKGYSISSYMMPQLASVCHGTTIITEPRITDVYWNEKYILATKCKNYSDTVVGYYIIEMLTDSNKINPWVMYGPMSIEEYKNKKIQFGLSETDMNYENVFKHWWEKIDWFWNKK